MDKKEINPKLNVFISSKINPRYTLIRKALGALLYESGLVGKVYVFEEEGATSDSVKSVYLKEVALSDLCIFLIDNKDGHNDNVYAEHKTAQAKGIHRLYFFCSERKKRATPLQIELEKTGELIYDPVACFSELPYRAYQIAIQDIINRYRRDVFPQPEIDVKPKDNGTAVSMLLNKAIFQRFTIKNHLSKVLYSFLTYTKSEKSEIIDSIEAKCATFLSTILGIEPFCATSFAELKLLLLKESTLLPAKILEHRLNAIDYYFNGNLDECYANLKDANTCASKDVSVPEWIKNDIAIDMRNVAAHMDESNNKISIYSEGQQIIDKSTEGVFYPLLDRFETNLQERIIKEYFENTTESPYTTRYLNAEHNFVDIASCFNVALRFGSLTHILATQRRYSDTLYSLYYSCNEATFFVPLIKTYILRQESSSLKKVINKYPNAIDGLSVLDIDTLIKAVSCEPILHLRNISNYLLLEYCGYYMSDRQFEQQADWFFTIATAWCENEKRILNHGSAILKTAKSIVFRAGAQAVLSLLLQFVHNELWRFVDEIIETINSIEFSRLIPEEEKTLLSIVIMILDSKKALNTLILEHAILSIRQAVNSDATLLDEAVKSNLPDYFDEYLTYILKIDQKRLDKSIQEIKSRNENDHAPQTYVIYASNPYSTTINLLMDSDISYEKLPVKDLISVIQTTIKGETQQHDLKEGALKLAAFLLMKYPSKSWNRLISTIFTYEKLQPYHYKRPIIDESRPNLLSFNFLLFRIAAHKCTRSECLIGFSAIANQNERHQIEAARVICLFLHSYDFKTSDNQIDHAIFSFVLSISEKNHSHTQRYTIDSLLSFTRHMEYQALALERLAYLFDHTTSQNKATILYGIKSNEIIITATGKYILQKGRTDTNYCIRSITHNVERTLKENR